MRPSPLTLARSFEQLRSRLESQPAADLRLLLLAEFWPSLSVFRDDPSYQSYFDEYPSLLIHDISEKTLADLLPAELQQLLQIALELRSYHKSIERARSADGGPSSADLDGSTSHRDRQMSSSADLVHPPISPSLSPSAQAGGPSAKIGPEIEPHLELLALEAARKFFYVGAVDEALHCLARGFGIVVTGAWLTSSSTTPVGAQLSPSAQAGGPQQTRSTPATDHDLSELDLLRAVRSQLTEIDSPLVPIVSRILRDWETERVALSFDEAHCLFVEKNSRGEHIRGRLRSLSGSAEYRRSSATNHELTVDNQVKTPDDPFVGCIHNSLDAATRLLGRTGGAWLTSPSTTPVGAQLSPSAQAGGPLSVGRDPRGPDTGDVGMTSIPTYKNAGGARGRAGPWVRARFRVVDSDHTFTGDSIGLAAGLVAYAQLLHPEVHKHERFIACEAAFTGGLDQTGRLTLVSVDSLKRKIERAFFSPIRYLVLPQENLDTARWCVDEMRRAYPRRKLHLVGASTLREVIDNLNIVRAERVCMGQFVARKAYKYTRATKIQVPLLLGLAYLLVCLIYPKAWVGFDDNPFYGRFNIQANTLEVFNQDSTLLWAHTLGCDIEYDNPECHKLVDLNGDNISEVLFLVPTVAECAHRDTLFCYSHDHRLLFKKYCATPNEYPGDSGATQYSPTRISTIELAGEPVIITEVVDGKTGLGHIRFWSAEGKPMGWYVNAGGPHYFASRDMDGDGRDEAIFLNFNNPMGASAFLVLRPDSAFGVSPPYDIPHLDLSTVRRGNQLSYIVFPKTDLGEKELREPYNIPFRIWADRADRLNAYIGESANDAAAHMIYSIDSRCRVAECWPTDQFKRRQDRLVEAGSLPPVDWEEYKSKVRDAVLYWTDSGWVSEGQLRAAGQ